ncbi:RloB family protein [Helicobacter equorum]|uniref:RloB family protein n=1 Tax=Helicobacter equorum TaxID=361872 RepID=UPI000CF01A66|nr:RloB family protein [Helicobacter equorum]
MGSDDLHKKRNTNLRKRHSERETNEVILIVCEGEKTEINYLKQLKDFFRLSNVRINIISSKKSNPLQIVTFAKGKHKDHSYSKVYCVFDKDTHSTFDEALEKCKKYNFEAIVSNPCFEFWILLHFTYTTANFHTDNKNSPCDKLISNYLKTHIKDYSKSYKSFAQLIEDKFNQAIENAIKANKEAEDNNYTSPYTFMYKLASKFKELHNAK